MVISHGLRIRQVKKGIFFEKSNRKSRVGGRQNLPPDRKSPLDFRAKLSVEGSMKSLVRGLFLVVLLFPLSGAAQEYMVYSIDQEIPMGEPGEVVKKNYYITMGADQGLALGTVLNVYRVFSRMDPYNSQKRYRHKIKVAEIKVVHTEKTSAVGSLVSLRNAPEDPLFNIAAITVGDRVEVNVD